MVRGHRIDPIIEKLESSPVSPLAKHKICSWKVLRRIKRRLSVVYICELLLDNNVRKLIVVKKLIFYKNFYSHKESLEKRIHREYDNTLTAIKNLSHNTAYRVPKPICIFPEDYSIVSEYIDDALSVEKLLLLTSKKFVGDMSRYAAEKIDIVSNCGVLLANLHSCSLSQYESCFTEIFFVSLKKYLFLKIDKISELASDRNVQSWCMTVKKYITEAIKLLVAPKYEKKERLFLVTAHGDYTPSNILIHDEKYYLIDFADCRRESAALDLSCFIVYLEMLALNKPFLYSKREIEKLQSAFLNAYETATVKKVLMPPASYLKLYCLRYLLTNLIMQFYDAKRNFIFSLIYGRRITRYMEKIKEIAERLI